MQVQTNIVDEAFAQGVWPVEKIDTLIETNREEALQHMLQLLQADRACYRAIGILYLGRIGDQRAVTPLLQFIQDTSRYNQFDPRKMSFRNRLRMRLSKWMRDTNHLIYSTSRVLDLRSAAYVLGQLGATNAVEALHALCDDPDEQIRNTAQKALANLGAGVPDRFLDGE